MLDHLDDLPEDEANSYAARRMRNEVSSSIRLAQVEATLAVVEAITLATRPAVHNTYYTSGEQA